MVYIVLHTEVYILRLRKGVGTQKLTLDVGDKRKGEWEEGQAQTPN